MSDNREQYVIDGHVVLKMHETNLNAWACKMTYWENSADELALYTLSDLMKQHTVVLTSTKPWSTVHPDVVIKSTRHLLGGNKFGRLCRRPQNYDTSVMVNLPVFPGTEPPSDREWETAYSLLSMTTQGNNNDNVGSSGQLELLEPSTVPNAGASSHMEIVSDLPDLTGMLGPPSPDHTTDTFSDAMEHIVGHTLTDHIPAPLKVPDAADSLCTNMVLVETSDTPKTKYAMVEPQIEEQLKPCSIRLRRIDSVLSYVPKQNLCHALMHAGRPHTRSMCTPKPSKRGNRRKASLCKVNYKDPDTSEDEPVKKKSGSGSKPR